VAENGEEAGSRVVFAASRPAGFQVSVGMKPETTAASMEPLVKRKTFAAARGFTLVELLVVIAIIAVLISLTMPSLQQALQKTRRVSCANQMRQLSLSMLTYAYDNRGQLPGYWTFGPPPRDWLTDTTNYVSESIVACPDQNRSGKGYGLSIWLATREGRSLEEAPFAARTCLFGEIIENVDRSVPWGYVYDHRFEPDPRHDQGLNMSFTDGHVQFIPDANLEREMHAEGGRIEGTFWAPHLSR
jgi:prepilin-type N-terminal cleavage/methylation domain-containing protein/prepilin-type processing-associated H-X9-DG protein